LKVLIVHSLYNQKGGEDIVFQNELDLLSKEHEVMFITFQNKIGWRGALQFLFSIWNLYSGNKLIAKLQTFKPDIIHLHNIHFAIGPIAVRIGKKAKVPVVATVHNFRLICPSAILLYKGKLYMESYKSIFPWLAVWKKVYRNSMSQTFWLAFINWFHKKIGTWQLIDRYIVLSQFSKELFLQSRLQLSDLKMVVKPNYVKPNIYTFKERNNHFLFVGRVCEEKGIEILINAFKESNYNIFIAGEGPMVNYVKEASNVNKNITYLGILDPTYIQKQMSICSALIFPSIWFEGMPMTILEAFASGTPVIASKLGAMEYMIEDGFNGFHFEPGDSKDLRNKIEMWQALPENEKKSFRMNSHKTYESHYTPEKNIEQLLSIYNSVIEDKKDC
jgi:glycosyltransferase involved in cell wall biosynthesis